MATYRTLYSGSGISIDEWRCTGRGSEEESSTFNPEHTFALPLKGAFRKHLGNEEGVATPGSVVFFRRGEEYRTSHPVEGGDSGLALRLHEGPFRHALDELGRPVPEPAVETVIAPATALRLRKLLSAIHGVSVPQLDLEETASRLVSEILDRVWASDNHRDRESTYRAHRRAVARVLELCAERFHESLSLEEIAREAAYSPFHLSRVFKRSTGVSIHRHVNRLRLTAALDRAGSLGELSRLALELGFSSHSHFTTSFRREFGAPPTRILPLLQKDS